LRGTWDGHAEVGVGGVVTDYLKHLTNNYNVIAVATDKGNTSPCSESRVWHVKAVIPFGNRQPPTVRMGVGMGSQRR
jgi:hypothetical protein